jgi:hypothetical protein
MKSHVHILCFLPSFPSKQIEYHPRGRWRPGRPLKRLLDGVQIETETGHMGLISWWNTTTTQIKAVHMKCVPF